MNAFIHEIIVHEASELLKYTDDKYIYRGQANAGWTLLSSIDRYCEQFPKGNRSAVEYELVREFRRAYHQYSLHIPQVTACMEWLSLMQHHGAPTRLLDFTYSIYIAGYFAIEQMKCDGAIWRIDQKWAWECIKDKFEAQEDEVPRGAYSMRHPHEPNDERWLEEYCESSAPIRGAWAANAYRLNDRLRTQQGLFMLQGDIQSTFSTNLEQMPGCDCPEHILKLVIPKSQKARLKEDLFRMGLSRRVLFPGIDGFAQSLGIYHPTVVAASRRIHRKGPAYE